MTGKLIKLFESSADDSQVLWSIRGPQKFLMIKLGGFGLIAKYNDDSLAVINPVKLTKTLAEELEKLQEETKCSVKVLLSAGDYHHYHLVDWSKKFPDAKLYVASDRILKKQPSLRNPIVLDQLNPASSIPELQESFDIVPFLGMKTGLPLVFGDKIGDVRVEHVVFHKSTKTLFVTDHVFAGPEMFFNTGGCSIKDADAATKSARKVLALGPKNIVFSHGKEETFSIKDREDTSNNKKSCVQLLENAYKVFMK